MFLKRLDVVGFKSFAERISVDFVPGVTAVVGPNGSGKSNITDAVRWVLGEQSAKSLRGTKMEDIIFAGSDSRRALNFAEVTLTLDNEDQFLPVDYNEVSVTRRSYRSGESEFLINKQSCRLKDIIDLFMDSGLGREAFSIISQGKVEEILNSKAEDRRTIFEEAAGVLKYKNRKKKAEMKLMETQENLNRVSDILYELESQVEPLKIQASIAKDYLEKKEELEHFEVALTVYDIEDFHAKWEKLSKQLEQHQQDELKLSSEIQKKEAKIEEWRDRIAALDESINDLQNVLLSTTEEHEKLEGRKEVLKERKKNAAQNKQQLEKNLLELTEKVQWLSKQKEEQASEVVKLSTEVMKLQKALDNKRSQFQLFSENIEAKIESLKSDYIELLNSQAGSKNELRYIDQQLEQQDLRKNRLDHSNVKYLQEREEISTKKTAVLDALAQAKAKLQTQVQSYFQHQKNLEALKENYQKQEKMLYQAYQYLQQSKSRKEMLEEMEEDFSGFFQGVKEVLKARTHTLKGIEGAVAELISVPKQYETAIETALGAAMQHIVVDTEENARKAIGFLKQHTFGRATFLPLNVIKGKQVAANLLQTVQQHPDFIGTAASLIQFDGKFQDVISSLLGNVVITHNLKGANELAKLLQYRSRIVTLDGDIVNPGGSMTGGGSKQKTNSLLSRKGELEELKEKIADMEVKTDKLENQVKSLKVEIQSNEDDLELLRTTGESLRFKEQELKGDLREIEVEESNINERLSLYDMDKQQFKVEKETLGIRKKELAQLLENLVVEIAALDEEISKLSKQKSVESTSKEALSSEINDLKILLASRNEQFSHANEKLTGTNRELDENTKKLTIVSEDLHLLSSEMTHSSSGEIQLELAAKQMLLDKNETVTLISSRREERVNWQMELEDAELATKERKRQHRGMIGNLKDEEVKLNRLDVELETRLTHLREEYLLSFEGAKEQYQLPIPVDEARRKVKLIRLAIEELGTVNIGAIEEYERISERYEFLFEQKNDLQEAKDTLFLVIGEMDEEMKKRFEQTFTGIRSHFEPTFQALFGGGRADLRLTDPDDLLNTGVEICAQPPGKKL